MATHSDNRPHVCKNCGKAYKRSTHLRRHEESAHKVVSKGRKVQRLQTNENGELVPVVEAKKEKNETQQNVYCENIVDSEFVTVLQATEDIPVVENSDLIYFNVIDNFNCTE